jgi:hypothetical protein
MYNNIADIDQEIAGLRKQRDIDVNQAPLAIILGESNNS